MSAQTSRYGSDTLPAETVDVVVIEGVAAGLNDTLAGSHINALPAAADPGAADTDAA
ncbi:hypothetical protein [Microbispora bryophytorum]|uniref:hypothetical protein n=1 Tax=Microbispora bryophytorum TaxID=1460882 RepID=UPI00340AED2F